MVKCIYCHLRGNVLMQRSIYFNNWIRLYENHVIRKEEENLIGARLLLGAINNDLLFIVHPLCIIKVIDLNTMDCISINIMDNNVINYDCFIHLTDNNEKVENNFILFCDYKVLLIKYDEKSRHFDYEQLLDYVKFDITFNSFVSIHDFIFLFGGIDNTKIEYIDSVYKYSMKSRTLDKCNIKLPIKSSSYFAILNNDYSCVHVIGGSDCNTKVHFIINLEKLFEISELINLENFNTLNYKLKMLLEENDNLI
ncbi:hypothetical protein RFI_32275 [Reticulomyxa filosa]|uniref:Uncharacterized protein n=1 Tax=Reticulomyxa filosa TaxID=46433 RepID=X6LUQ8_RETFI|nr:hypothetical protein RFI_32275 [Reticulomyxa filosa]|eukprot:ETO05121.1 hypothetical protein RFI_32275 [Reticulomyxa filosa]